MGLVRARDDSCNNAMIQESGVHVRHERGDRAFYNMQTDTVIGEVHHQVKLTESAAPDTHASTADA